MVGRLLEGPLASGGTWEGTEAGQGDGEMVAGRGPGRREDRATEHGESAGMGWGRGKKEGVVMKLRLPVWGAPAFSIHSLPLEGF